MHAPHIWTVGKYIQNDFYCFVLYIINIVQLLLKPFFSLVKVFDFFFENLTVTKKNIINQLFELTMMITQENNFSHYYGVLTPLNQWWKNL